jgi:hypothetical protein
MKNTYEIVGNEAHIHLLYKKRQMICRVDLADIALLREYPVKTWSPNPAKAPAGKFYVNGKKWDKIQRKNKTIMLHRLLMGFPNCDVNHCDNDGLNNTRKNLSKLTHQDNIRDHWPDRSWIEYDALVLLEEEYRKEREIALQVQSQYGITRQSMWKIRNGRTGRSKSRIPYLEALMKAGIRTFEELQKLRSREGKWGIGIDKPKESWRKNR